MGMLNTYPYFFRRILILSIKSIGKYIAFISCISLIIITVLTKEKTLSIADNIKMLFCILLAEIGIIIALAYDDKIKIVKCTKVVIIYAISIIIYGIYNVFLYDSILRVVFNIVYDILLIIVFAILFSLLSVDLKK